MKSEFERIVSHFEEEKKNVCFHGNHPRVLSDFGWIAVECDSCCRYTDGEGHPLSVVLATWLERFAARRRQTNRLFVDRHKAVARPFTQLNHSDTVFSQ